MDTQTDGRTGKLKQMDDWEQVYPSFRACLVINKPKINLRLNLLSNILKAAVTIDHTALFYWSTLTTSLFYWLTSTVLLFFWSTVTILLFSTGRSRPLQKQQVSSCPANLWI